MDTNRRVASGTNPAANPASTLSPIRAKMEATITPGISAGMSDRPRRSAFAGRSSIVFMAGSPHVKAASGQQRAAFGGDAPGRERFVGFDKALVLGEGEDKV